jgi:hypothetical protein
MLVRAAPAASSVRTNIRRSPAPKFKRTTSSALPGGDLMDIFGPQLLAAQSVRCRRQLAGVMVEGDSRVSNAGGRFLGSVTDHQSRAEASQDATKAAIRRITLGSARSGA